MVRLGFRRRSILSDAPGSAPGWVKGHVLAKASSFSRRRTIAPAMSVQIPIGITITTTVKAKPPRAWLSMNLPPDS